MWRPRVPTSRPGNAKWSQRIPFAFRCSVRVCARVDFPTPSGPSSTNSFPRFDMSISLSVARPDVFLSGLPDILEFSQQVTKVCLVYVAKFSDSSHACHLRETKVQFVGNKTPQVAQSQEVAI